MMYKKVIINGYIIGVGEVFSGGNIDEEEYTRLTEVFLSMPTAPEGYHYMLKADETWELIKNSDPYDEEIDDSEAVEILLGGAS